MTSGLAEISKAHVWLIMLSGVEERSRRLVLTHSLNTVVLRSNSVFVCETPLPYTASVLTVARRISGVTSDCCLCRWLPQAGAPPSQQQQHLVQCPGLHCLCTAGCCPVHQRPSVASCQPGSGPSCVSTLYCLSWPPAGVVCLSATLRPLRFRRRPLPMKQRYAALPTHTSLICM